MPGNMQWLDAKNVLVNYCSEAFKSVQQLKNALQSLAEDERVQKRLVLALARVSLEKHLPTEVVWSDIERLAEKVRPKDLRAAVADSAGQGFSCKCSAQPVLMQVKPCRGFFKLALTPDEAVLPWMSYVTSPSTSSRVLKCSAR